MDPSGVDVEQRTSARADQGPRPGGRGPRWLILLLVAIPLIALLTADGLMLLADHDARTTGASSQASGASTVSAADAARARAQARGRAIQQMLDRRGSAIVHHDATAFLATVDPDQPQFLAQQRTWFRNLSQVPFAAWSYSFDPGSQQSGSAALTRYHAPVYAPSQVAVHYRLANFDTRPTDQPELLTFVQRGSRWFVASTTDFDGGPNPPPADLWDFGPVRVVHGASTLVLGHPDSLALMHVLADETDAAIPRVTQVWGADWSRRAVVLVPSTQDELSQMVPDIGSLDQIAAVATAEVRSGTARPDPLADRVLVNPPNFAKLAPLGRRVVLTHEITHVAARGSTGRDVPEWLVEGFADYVGYSGTGISVAVAGRELRADVLAGHPPTKLPDDAAFAGADPRLPQVYEESWLACRMIAQRWGEPTLVGIYRRLGLATTDEDVAVASVMHDLLHTTPAAFTQSWAQYVRAQLS